MALNVVKCTSCGRLTPTKNGECIYCQTSLAARAKRTMKVGAAGPTPMHEEPRVLGGRSKRFTRRSDDRNHSLVVGSREPIPLDPGKLFVLGRDTRASLVVHAPDVSRQHAEIEWDDHDPPRPLLCEVRSSNGTFLNGKKVTRDTPMPLRSGDEVRLGETFSFTYLHVGEHELKHELDERGRVETRRFRKDELTAPEGFPAATPAATPSGSGIVARDALEQLVAAMAPESEPAPLPLEGSLATLNGAELLQRLHRQASSGLLTLWSGPNSGELQLQEGRCTRARFSSLTGRAAMEHVAGLSQGLYRFAPDGALAQPPAEDPGATTLIGSLRPGRPELPLGPTLRLSTRPSESPAPGMEGDLAATGGWELLHRLQREGRTGVLSIQDGPTRGEVIWVDGLPEQAQLGAWEGQAALDRLSEMRRGSWHFQPQGPPAARPPRAPARPTAITPLKRVMPLRKEQAPENKRPPLRAPSDLGQIESGVQRRPAPPPPVRPPAPGRPGLPRRRPPPLPHRPE